MPDLDEILLELKSELAWVQTCTDQDYEKSSDGRPRDAVIDELKKEIDELEEKIRWIDYNVIYGSDGHLCQGGKQ